MQRRDAAAEAGTPRCCRRQGPQPLFCMGAAGLVRRGEGDGQGVPSAVVPKRWRAQVPVLPPVPGLTSKRRPVGLGASVMSVVSCSSLSQQCALLVWVELLHYK